MKNKLSKLMIAASLGMMSTFATSALAIEYHSTYGMNEAEAEARFLSWANGRTVNYSCYSHYYQGVLAYGYCSGSAY